MRTAEVIEKEITDLENLLKGIVHASLQVLLYGNTRPLAKNIQIHDTKTHNVKTYIMSIAKWFR